MCPPHTQPGCGHRQISSRVPSPGLDGPVWCFTCGVTAPRKSLSEQLFPDILMSLELARVDALANFVAVGAEPRTALDEEIDHVIIEREQCVTPLTFGFEHNSLCACGFEDLADRRVRVTDRLNSHCDPPPEF